MLGAYSVLLHGQDEKVGGQKMSDFVGAQAKYRNCPPNEREGIKNGKILST